MRNRLIVLIMACAIRTSTSETPKNQQIEDVIMDEIYFLQGTTTDCENQTGGSIDKLDSTRTTKKMKATQNRKKAYKEEIEKVKNLLQDKQYQNILNEVIKHLKYLEN